MPAGNDKDKKRPPTGPSRSKQGDAKNVFEAAQATFHQQVEQISAELERRYAEQYESYGSAMASAQRDFEETCAHAWQRYANDLNEAWGGGETAGKAVEAHERCVALFNELQPGDSVHHTLSEAYVKFANQIAQSALSSAPEEARADGHQAYVQALEQAVGASEAYKRAAEAHADYLVLLRKLHDDRWRGAYDGYISYVKAIGDALAATDFPARMDTALESSLAGLQAAWATGTGRIQRCVSDTAQSAAGGDRRK